MSDLINRQAVIDTLKDMYQVAEKWGQEASDDIVKARAESCMASLVEMKLRIENLPPAQPEQRWIPVSERLPDDLQKVLVWYEYWHWKAEELKPEYGIGWRFIGLWCGDPGNGSKLRVIAWMPLPEPPKEEQDANGTRTLSDTLGSDSE